jgi:type II secretory pathway component PulF
MPTFRYEAAHENARVEAGELEADSARAARAALRTRGLVAISVEAVGQPGAVSGRASRRRLSISELALATRQLASLIGAGLSLDMALSTLVEQADVAGARRRATAFATLLEPALILAMGAVVLGIVLAVLMPIIEINQLVR